MTTVTLQNSQLETRLPIEWSIADLQAHLGGIPLDRIRMYPPPGMATLADAIYVDQHEDLACELIDGVLVEKTMGWFQSMLANMISFELMKYLEEHDLGRVLTTDATLQILPNQMRMPDVCFISWKRFPDAKLPTESMPPLVPDLAVEVLSPSNTPAEMQRKLDDYFAAGVELVWYIDPQTRSARSFTAPNKVEGIAADGVLDGKTVLPGFTLPLQPLFEKAERFGPNA